MQSSQKLTRFLRALLSLVEDEASRNPAFAERLEAISPNVPSTAAKRRPKTALQDNAALPDVFAIFQEKGTEEFFFWLRSLDLPILKAVVKVNGFDPGKTTVRWTDSDRFATFISEQVNARLRRGSAFLPPKVSVDDPEGSK